MIEAVVFDWGGVIQRTEDPAPRRRLDRELGLPHEGVERAVFESEAWRLASTGCMSADQAWAEIVAGLGYPGAVRAFVEAFFAGDRVDDELVALIGDLRRRGVRVGLLSNAIPPRQGGDSPAGRWGRAGLFDAQVFSYEVGVLKPDPRMYLAILEALSVAAPNAFFVDDAAANVEGARAVGLAAWRFTGTDDLLGELARLGLLRD